ncbi:MAG: MFS transporter, partial [Actinobacteria bacterium]|nr:MFS transporter [Actinomycetota bacterium]
MLVVNAVALLAVQGVRPAVSYRALELGASAASLGLIAASFSVLAVVLAIPLGGGIDPHRERWYMIGGSALIAVSSALLPVITSVVGLAVDQAMLGLGYLLVVLAGQTSVARIFPPGQRQRAYGLFTVAGGIGALLGPLGLAAVASGPGNSLAGWVWSLDLVFLAAAVCGVLSTGVA